MKRILHFGPGNFFRAHLADYTQDLEGWSITAVSLRSARVRDGLARQGYKYTLDTQGIGSRKITAIDNIIVGVEEPETVLDLIKSERIPVISATVTEKGYNLKPDGRLNLDDPDIVHDLSKHPPKTFIGFLARGLAERTAPVTVLSCDNRSSNGDTLARAVADFQDAANIRMRCNAIFPNAMVDRITPATTAEVIKKTGDPMAVSCEPYKEWVIEDRFASSRPNWPSVEWVEDVSAYEMRKLRLLNGVHSYLAYAGTLAGHEYVHEAIRDPKLRHCARDMMNEAILTLPSSIQSQSAVYAENLIARFDNKNVKHRLRQIAADGSQKLPYRMVESIRARAKQGLGSPALIEGIRSWLIFVDSEAHAGRQLQDPIADELTKASRADNSIEATLSLIGASDLSSQIAG